MRTISATIRLTIGLICLSISVWLAAYSLGMFPDRESAVVEGRAALAESVAVQCSLMTGRGDRKTIETALDLLAERNDDVESVAVRRPDGSLTIAAGNHVGHWNLPPGHRSTPSQMRIAILAGGAQYGTVEVRFRERRNATLLAWVNHPLLLLFCFVAAATSLLYYIYLRAMLQHLDPSRVIPKRVRATLDTLAEGLLVLDKKERILLANRAFADRLGASADKLTGRNVSELPWEIEDGRLTTDGYPWQRAIQRNSPQTGELLTIQDKNKRRRIFNVSAMPVHGEDGVQRGTMASFDDVTEIEESRKDLRQTLDALSESRDEIHRQNEELEKLATRDSLTACLTRRAFFAAMENCWSFAERKDAPLACIMVDLDHFKSINDTHGHQTGDMVLEKTSELLRAGRRPTDLVCRYGGEEFCILLPHADIDGACSAAERIRKNIEAGDFDNLSVTASIGVTARSPEVTDPQVLIDQADQALYVAKRSGRNRVVRFGEVAARPEASCPTGQSSASSESDTSEHDSSIPFHAVTALVSALAFRDPSTADHSRRVSDLCVATARRLMPVSDSYILEIAALLHDIGKIGVPDSVLLKPGKLSDEEWQVMNSHERIGAEIVHSTFSSSKLVEIIRTYRAWFGGNARHPELPTGEDIPLAARILAIADAYDSMTNRTAYREPLSREEAFTELHRCAGRQFDPQLVERFIDTVNGRDGGQTDSIANVSKAAALSICTQIQRLAEVLDSQDLVGVAALAGRLKMTAVSYDSERIAEVASRLEEAGRGDTDVKDLAQLTIELVDLCRSIQRAYLNAATGPAGSPAAEPCSPLCDAEPTAPQCDAPENLQYSD